MTPYTLQSILPLYLGQKFVLKITNPLSEHKYTAQMYFGVDALRAALATNSDHIDPLLILRPLSSMTEEEAIELFKLEHSGRVKPNWTSIELKREDVRPFHEKLGVEPSYRVSAKYLLDNGKESGMHGSMSMTNFNSDQFLWLLSKGFDIFDLKEKGLCLYPEEL